MSLCCDWNPYRGVKLYMAISRNKECLESYLGNVFPVETKFTLALPVKIFEFKANSLGAYMKLVVSLF